MTRSMEEIYQALRAEREVLEAAAAAVTYPAPEVSSRDPWPADFVAPEPVVALRLLAERHGWSAEMTYARGHSPHGTTGQPTALRHTVAVRVRHAATGRAAYAVYTCPVKGGAWTWKSVMLRDKGMAPFPHGLVTDLKEWIKAPTGVDARWYTRIRDREQAKVAKKAARPAGSGRKKGPVS